jgi:sigma-B regulation protein RsbU (phosphoserine phosphatase)
MEQELLLAHNIQDAALPKNFTFNHEGFEIFATMDPAKEVGGDFYDFFLIDDDHLCLIIADVSGKGVPAALFMMACKIIFKNYAMMGNRRHRF